MRPVDSMKLWSVRSPQVANRASTWFELRTAALPVVSTGIGAIPEIVEQRLDSRRTTDLLLQQVGAAAREFIA